MKKAIAAALTLVLFCIVNAIASYARADCAAKGDTNCTNNVAIDGPTSVTRAAGAGASSGVPVWVHPGNITVFDGVYATNAISPSSAGGVLTASSFGFNIPANATILGIVVEIQHRRQPVSGSSGLANDLHLFLNKAGAQVGTDHASTFIWPLTEHSASYGSSSDLWGATWTAADINNSGFGVRLQAQEVGGAFAVSAQVDFIQITIYYQ